MRYEPKSGDRTAIYLSEHGEKRIYHRFPRLKLRSGYEIYTLQCESEKAESAWAIPIHGGYLIGKWEKGINGRLNGYFVVQTALYNWQFKRSKFKVVQSVKVFVQTLQSQIEDKIRNGVEVSPDSLEAYRSVSSGAIMWQRKENGNN